VYLGEFDMSNQFTRRGLFLRYEINVLWTDLPDALSQACKLPVPISSPSSTPSETGAELARTKLSAVTSARYLVASLLVRMDFDDDRHQF
jgi:hypothetical protein